MAKPVHSAHLDTDGLQADVMRFMAIIAFCLIAILALVKNIDPPKSESAVAIDSQASESRPGEPPSQSDSPAAEPVISGRVVEQAERQIPVPEPVKQQKEVVRSIVTADQELAAPEPTARPEAADEPQLADEDSHHIDEPTPSLRFSSDSAFLSLIAREGIRVYGLGGGGFAAMSTDFTISTVQPTGQLYELMPGSVPRKIVNIFEKESTDLVYLVALSETTRGDLDNLLQKIQQDSPGDSTDSRQINGTLVIHRDGHVSYEI